MPMGMAAPAYVLWTQYLRHNPRNPAWINRDRFVLSAGHGCMLLYALLHLTGYDLSLEDLKNFRQWGSKTPGHPEFGHTPGVEVTTGPLGQGISNAVGMAIAGKYLAAYFNREGFPLFDYRVYVIAGDGCLQEGVASEACSLAGHLGIDNLIVLYDDNRITIDGATDLSFSEDAGKRFEAYGWSVQEVGGDGNDLVAVGRALDKAVAQSGRPSLIKVRTHIGYGSPGKQDSHEAHGSPLGDEEIARTKIRFGWDPDQKFVIPDDALGAFRKHVEKGAVREGEWNDLLRRYRTAFPEQAAELDCAAKGQMPPQWEFVWREHAPVFDPSVPLATREAQGRILDALMPHLPLVLGGSADLTPSNNTRFKGAVDFSRTNRLGRYVRYGVREHAMGAILNGIAVTGGLIPYGGTFFTFSDYMRPSIRLAALSRYPSIFVFTHDSIGLGEDGPTHQAVEHLAALRAMPGMVVLRPADANETLWAWKFALEHRSGPTVLALTRQKLPVLDQTMFPSAEQTVRGAYILVDTPNPQLILVATGSEVSLALKAAGILGSEGRRVRVVSMPSWELFEAQDLAYREQVLPARIKARVAVEAGVQQGWERYIGEVGAFVGMKGFGASAPAEVAFRSFGITVDAIAGAARRILS